MELSAALAANLDAAYPEVVRALQGQVFSTARQLLGNRHDAEDAAQETFVRVYRALSRFSTERILDLRIRSYVWTTLINVCRNQARSSRRHPQTALEVDHGFVDPGSTGVEASATWGPRLARLPERQRTAVVMHHVAGLPYVEVAEALGVPVGTAKADVHRALARLRTMIETEGEVA